MWGNCGESEDNESIQSRLYTYSRNADHGYSTALRDVVCSVRSCQSEKGGLRSKALFDWCIRLVIWPTLSKTQLRSSVMPAIRHTLFTCTMAQP